jgi:anti-anti-sigma factor
VAHSSRNAASRTGDEVKASDVGTEEYANGAVTVVEATGDLDILNISDFKNRVRLVLETAEVLVIDLRPVNYIDSAGLEQIVSAYSRMRKRGKPLAILAKPGSQPRDILRLVQIDQVAPVAGDLSELGLES